MMIDDILLFIKVVEAGSILAIEKRFAIPRSTISRKLTSLEKRVGLSLMFRTHRGIILTEDGNYFYEKFKNYDQHLATIFKNNDAAANVSGRLNVLLPIFMVHEILMPNLYDFVKKYPRIELNIMQNFGCFNMKKAIYDIAIVDYIPLQQAQKIKKIFTTERAFVCSQQYATNIGIWNSLKDSGNHIIARKSDHNDTVPRYLKVTSCSNGNTDNIRVKHTVSFSSFVEIKQFVLNHSGVGELPLAMAKHEIESQKLIKLFPNYEIEHVQYSLLRNIDANNSCYIVFINFFNNILDMYLADNRLLK